MTDYPKTDDGFYHLTQHGWIRKDKPPFPEDRVETWSYSMECPAEDAKERVCLTCTWRESDTDPAQCEMLRAKFGTPVPLTSSRNIVLESEI